MSKQLLKMSIAVGGWRPQHSEDQHFCGALLGSNSGLVQNMSIGRDSFLHLFVRYVCAENTDQYWDNTCLQLSSIQGSGMDMAEELVSQFIKI